MHLNLTRNGKYVIRFSTREPRVVMTFAPECVVIFDEKRNEDLALLLGRERTLAEGLSTAKMLPRSHFGRAERCHLFTYTVT